MSNRKYVRRLINALYRLDGLYVEGGKLSGANGNIIVFLYAMDDDKPHTQKSISDEWYIQRTTLNTIVKRFEKEGYLTMRHVPGTRREMELLLTDKGKEYAAEVLQPVYCVEEEAITETLKECKADFVDSFELFVDKLGEAFERQAKARESAEENKQD